MRFLAIALSTSLFFASCTEDNDNNNDGDDNPTTNDVAQLYASNNSNGNITVYNLAANPVETKTLLTASLAAEGIYYDATTDLVVQASRSFNQLNAYGSISTTGSNTTATLLFSGNVDLSSPRDIAVNGNTYVVSDNTDLNLDADPNTTENRYFIYTKSGNNFVLRNTVTVNFPVWEITFVGNDLYGVVDKSSDLVKFENFVSLNTTNAVVEPTKRITVQGIVRTHGLTFDGGTLVMTDIGDAMSDSDGAFQIITDFKAKFDATAANGMLSLSDQLRYDGASSGLGNPVSVDFDSESSTVYIAEAANEGGRILIFNKAALSRDTGNFGPSSSFALTQASSVYFYKD